MAFNYLLNNNNLITNNKLISILESVKSSKLRGLEIGFGTGKKTISIAKEFKSFYAIEPNKIYYDKFKEICKINKCNIKSYNMDLQNFVNYTNKKFNVIILINVIHLLNLDDFVKISKTILKKNNYIIIINPHEKPINWGNNEFNKNSELFDQNKWIKFKNKLKDLYLNLLNHKYFFKFDEDLYDKYFILKI